MNYKRDVLEVRKQRKVSVAKLAKITGISPDRIYKWESGVGNPKAEDSKILQNWLDGKVEKVQGNGDLTFESRDLSKEIGRILARQAGADAALNVLISEITPLIAKQTGKSNAAVFLQMKKDIEDETSKQIALLGKK